jgi:hypothetical protein
MKKLKLKALELGAMELLTRAQLKNVLGGYDGGGGGGLILCGGPGNYVEKCASNGKTFYCCHNSDSQCVKDNGGDTNNYMCSNA